MTISPEVILTPVEPPPPSAHGAPASLIRRIAGRLLHPGLFSIVDQGVVSGTNFLTILVVARTCSRADLGVYYLAWTVVVFLTAASCNLVSVPYTMYRHRHRGRKARAHAGSTLVHQLVLSAAGTACLLGVAALLQSGLGPQSLRGAAWALAAVMPLLLLREFVRRYAFAHFALRTALAVDLAASGLQLCGLFLLAFCLRRVSIPAVYLVMGGACAAVCAGWFALARPPLRLTAGRIFADWRDHWTFGKWALAGQLAGLCFYILPWVLAAVRGQAATGVFAVCNTLVGPANLFVVGTNNFVMPKAAHAFASGGARDLAAVLRSTLLLFVVVLGTFCAVAWFAGDIVAWICFGNRYLGSGTLIAVLALATFTDALGITAASGLWALDRPAANFTGDLLQLAVTLGVAVALVVPLGAMGIAIALLAGRAAGAALRWWVLQTYLAAGNSYSPLPPREGLGVRGLSRAPSTT
jgi:O-antigen/teichoic acid export membrane protein